VDFSEEENVGTVGSTDGISWENDWAFWLMSSIGESWGR